MRILIVDDEIIIRALLLDVLKSDGHEVDAVGNGYDALKLAKKNDYDIIFSDVHMPEMNGYELLTQIKSHHPQMAVVMMDSYPEELSERCMRDGAFHCVHKPFDISELRKVIKSIEDKKHSGDVS
ncbi:MAG: response regulator [Candidatus Aureabacteria bacterium]|nr:response regulator [Candidatus Auribacterota bacterium]